LVKVGFEEIKAKKAATSLAVTTLLATGLKPDHPAIGQGIEFLLGEDWNGFDAYDLSVVILALSATGQREKYLERVQFAVNRLLDKQLRTEEGAPQRDDGGWGYGAIADGAHMHYAIYALYTAKLWGAEIEQIGWDKAKGWVRSTQHTRGGWNYNMVESPWAEGPYGSMTATGLMALKMMGIPVTSDDFQKGMQWVIDHYTLTSNPGSFHWHYYYLLAMQRAMDTPPKQEFLGEHDWYQQMADVFVAQQYPDGRWEESDGETFASTCFGILFLTRYVPQAFAPDVSVVPEAIQLTPSTPAEGAPLSARFTLTNFGLPLANPIIEVAVYDGKSTDANLLATTEVLFSEGRSDANATVTWKAPRQGKHEITFVADPKKKIVSELDRANNAASVSLTVASAGATAQERSPLTELSPNVYAIGFGDKAAILDRNKSEVRIPGVVRPGSNVIEYLAVGPLGKVHETILTLEPEPVHIQTALLGLGVAPENNLRVQGDARTPSGAPMELWVSWERAGKTERHRAEELIWYASERRPLETTNWVFTGSRFQGPQFMADATKSLIAAYRDPDAILNHPLASGGEDGAYRANLALLPAKGTPVTLTVTPAHVP
ncbi:MAG: YdjY domain-containing protein, partial [Candidatus Poribacteria bacterium]|nr:YdjY domain-containing protein [Candidatus Poribacteria bacterium]